MLTERAIVTRRCVSARWKVGRHGASSRNPLHVRRGLQDLLERCEQGRDRLSARVFTEQPSNEPTFRERKHLPVIRFFVCACTRNVQAMRFGFDRYAPTEVFGDDFSSAQAVRAKLLCKPRCQGLAEDARIRVFVFAALDHKRSGFEFKQRALSHDAQRLT